MIRNQDKLTSLIDAGKIQRRVDELGEAITRHYQGKELLVLGIMQGSFPFMADLVRRIHLPLRTDFLRVSSYGTSTRSSGNVDFIWKPREPLAGQHVLVIEDIIDTGLTAGEILKWLEEQGVASVAIAALLVKDHKHNLGRKIEFAGFSIGDEFVVGYGLDYAGYYRNLDSISILEPSD